MTKSSEYTTKLDLVQTEVVRFLKPLGFKKKGRTFNRESEKGIWQVINIQSGQFPLGDNYVVPGSRENLYGKFTVNLGVFVQELYDIRFPSRPIKTIHEYDCHFRTRLSSISKGYDLWWDFRIGADEVAKEIIDLLNQKGIPWLDFLGTREKICENWNKVEGRSPRAQLDVALIHLQTDREQGERLFREYFNELRMEPHRGYVIELAKELNIRL
jgi:Domain of unknown function (DUF4304)